MDLLSTYDISARVRFITGKGKASEGLTYRPDAKQLDRENQRTDWSTCF